MDVMTVLTIVIPAVIGVLLCFKGFKLLRISLAVVGAVVGYVLASRILLQIHIPMSLPVRYGVLAVFAIGLGALSFGLYEKAVFFVGAAGGAFFAWSFYPADATGLNKWIVIVLSALVAGLAEKFINEWALKAFTALFGARLIAYALVLVASKIELLSTGVSALMVLLFKTTAISAAMAVSGLSIVIFAVVGFLHQLKER